MSASHPMCRSYSSESQKKDWSKRLSLRGNPRSKEVRMPFVFTILCGTWVFFLARNRACQLRRRCVPFHIFIFDGMRSSPKMGRASKLSNKKLDAESLRWLYSQWNRKKADAQSRTPTSAKAHHAHRKTRPQP